MQSAASLLEARHRPVRTLSTAASACRGTDSLAAPNEGASAASIAHRWARRVDDRFNISVNRLVMTDTRQVAPASRLLKTRTRREPPSRETVQRSAASKASRELNSSTKAREACRTKADTNNALRSRRLSRTLALTSPCNTRSPPCPIRILTLFCSGYRSAKLQNAELDLLCRLSPVTMQSRKVPAFPSSSSMTT